MENYTLTLDKNSDLSKIIHWLPILDNCQFMEKYVFCFHSTLIWDGKIIVNFSFKKFFSKKNKSYLAGFVCHKEMSDFENNFICELLELAKPTNGEQHGN